VYGKFIDVWRQKEAALQNSQITRVLLANSAHEVRTPLNAIINYLEIALEGDLDSETRENLTISYSASRSLIYVINDLLDLTATVEGGDLVQNETFDIRNVLKQVTDWFSRDARRKRIYFEVNVHEDTPLPVAVVGDSRRLRQGVSNIIANAIENTTTGGIRVDVATASLHATEVTIEICVSDTGVGMDSQKTSALYTEIAQLGPVQEKAQDDITDTAHSMLTARANAGEERILGLGLAVVARVVQNMHGQFRVNSKEGRGSRFVLVIPFGLPKPSPDKQTAEHELAVATADPGGNWSDGLLSETPTPSNPEEEVILVEFNDRSISHTPETTAKTSASRLIAEIQKPSEVEGWSRPGNTDQTTNAICDQKHDLEESDVVPGAALHPALDSGQIRHRTGTVKIEGQGQPLRASRIPSEFDIVSRGTLSNPTSADGEVRDIPSTVDRPLLPSSDVPQVPHQPGDTSNNISRPPSSEKMHVLVAEDNPLNSRILEKRLKKRGHEVHLTNNGEECAFAYREGKGRFDIILMDIQVRPNRPCQSSLSLFQKC
jgi:nitrogen-specific signal transduction histidine kinase